MINNHLIILNWLESPQVGLFGLWVSFTVNCICWHRWTGQKQAGTTELVTPATTWSQTACFVSRELVHRDTQSIRKARLIKKGSPSRKKLEHQALHSMLIYCERRPKSCRKLLCNYGPLAEIAHLIKTALPDLSSWEQSNVKKNVKNITFGFTPERHMDVKASLAKSGEVIRDNEARKYLGSWMVSVHTT